MTRARSTEEPCAGKLARTVLETSGGGDPSAEFHRQLRRAVIHRKVCYGSQSEDGMVWISRLLTVVMTLRSRGENPYEWLVEACRSARVKRAGPSLLPEKPAV